ncbi:unnamed protein product, partial [Amoebophrya sp. A25]|eukprot:GSA25T00027077001.1
MMSYNKGTAVSVRKMLMPSWTSLGLVLILASTSIFGPCVTEPPEDRSYKLSGSCFFPSGAYGYSTTAGSEIFSELLLRDSYTHDEQLLPGGAGEEPSVVAKKDIGEVNTTD